MNVIQRCFICHPSDSTVSEDAGIEPRTVATLALNPDWILIESGSNKDLDPKYWYYMVFARRVIFSYILPPPAANRVLYIDIDIHHGDGVQEAFYVSDRSANYVKILDLLQLINESMFAKKHTILL